MKENLNFNRGWGMGSKRAQPNLDQNLEKSQRPEAWVPGTNVAIIRNPQGYYWFYKQAEMLGSPFLPLQHYQQPHLSSVEAAVKWFGTKKTAGLQIIEDSVQINS